MRLFDFLDLRYQNLALDIQKLKKYNMAMDMEAKGCAWILSFMQKFFKVVAVPKLLFHFLLVNVGLLPKPTSPLYPTPKSVAATDAQKPSA